MIVAEQLTRTYGPRVAVDHVSFRVPTGEVVGFLGPNGAGKSTTLRMVAGFLPPTSGRVTVGGFDVVEESIEARSQLGYMPESSPLYPEMRVEEYLDFRAELKGVRRGRKKAVQDAMAKADVTDVARRLIGELSKGYRQRVGIADALVAEPKLLILDEPTAGLDPNQIIQVRELIKSLGKSHTVFLSTHILPEVEAVCSRVVIIARGKIAAEGTAEEIRARKAGNARGATLVVRGSEETTRSALSSIDGVKLLGEAAKVESLDAGGTGGAGEVLRFELELDDANGHAGALAERIAEACVAGKLGVRGLEVHGKSLEAIFQELTTDEKPPADAKAAESDAKPDDETKEAAS